MGFDLTEARAALHHFHADVQRSIEELLRVGGEVPQAWKDALQAVSGSSGSSGKLHR